MLESLRTNIQGPHLVAPGLSAGSVLEVIQGHPPCTPAVTPGQQPGQVVNQLLQCLINTLQGHLAVRFCTTGAGWKIGKVFAQLSAAEKHRCRCISRVTVQIVLQH